MTIPGLSNEEVAQVGEFERKIILETITPEEIREYVSIMNKIQEGEWDYSPIPGYVSEEEFKEAMKHGS